GVGQQVAAEHDFSSSCPTSHCTDSTSPERLQIQIRSRSPAAIPGADGLEHAAEVIGEALHVEQRIVRALHGEAQAQQVERVAIVAVQHGGGDEGGFVLADEFRHVQVMEQAGGDPAGEAVAAVREQRTTCPQCIGSGGACVVWQRVQQQVDVVVACQVFQVR